MAIQPIDINAVTIRITVHSEVNCMRHGRIKRGQRETYNRALHVLARMRRTGDTLTVASREEHIDPRTVRKYVGAELKGLIEGRTQPTKSDRRKRNMLIPTSLGPTPIVVRGSKQASQLGRYLSAVGKYLQTGNSDALEEFEGQSIAGHELITDREHFNWTKSTRYRSHRRDG